MRRARGWRRGSNRNKNRSSYACITAPESIPSIDIEGTTTMVCGSCFNRSVEFHNGTSFFCNRSNSAGELGTDEFIFKSSESIHEQMRQTQGGTRCPLARRSLGEGGSTRRKSRTLPADIPRPRWLAWASSSEKSIHLRNVCYL